MTHPVTAMGFYNTCDHSLTRNFAYVASNYSY